MSQSNVELVRRYYQVTSGDRITEGDVTGIEEIVAPDFVDHHFPPTLPAGPDGVKAFFNDVLGAFTSRRIDIFDIFATEDRVGVRFELVANHTSEFAGYQPSGKQINCGAMSMFRVEDGKLAEGWETADLFGLFQQLQALQAVPA